MGNLQVKEREPKLVIDEDESEFSLTNRCKLYLEELLSSVSLLQSKISQSSSFAYYFSPGSPPLQDRQACSMAASVIGELFYQKGNIEPATKDSFSVIAVDEQTIEYAVQLNKHKRIFKQFHSEYRRRFTTEREATTEFREMLKRTGYPELYIPSLDRQVPVLSLSPTQISWYYNTATVSKKKTISDALVELYKLQDVFYGEKRDELDSEIQRLEALGAAYPVAHKMRKPHTALHVWASGLDENSLKCSERFYGRNPVLYLNRNTFKPHVNLPPEISGIRTKSSRRGRPKLMKDEPLTRYLKNWFAYKEPLETDTKVLHQKDSGGRKRSIQTQVPGIFLALSPQNTPIFRFISKSGNRSSVSINRHGLRGAWERAVNNSNSDLVKVNSAQDFYSSCPHEEDLKKLL